MKKLLLFIFICCSNLCFGQYCKVEDIKLDSVQMISWNIYTEGCQKLQYRYVTQEKCSCPIYLDEQGFFFFLTIKDGFVYTEVLEKLDD